MATRFYLPSSGAAAVSPAFGGWNDTSIATRLKAVTTKISSAMSTVSYNDANDTQQAILFRQWVSDPIEAQTIAAQIIEIQVRCSETDAGNNLNLAWNVRVFSNDGGTLRGNVVAGRVDTTEIAVTTLTNRRDTLTSTQVVAEAGDRIVIEVGISGNPGPGLSHDSSISIGDDSASDLPENDSTTTADNPWLEFPNTITFVTNPAPSVTDSVSVSDTPTVAALELAGVNTSESILVSDTPTVQLEGDITLNINVSESITVSDTPTVAKESEDPLGISVSESITVKDIRTIFPITTATAIKLGVIGDSNIDEFRGTDNRGGAYRSVTASPVEILVNAKTTSVVNPGAWGAYAEPRRTGYAQNWARTGICAGSLFNRGLDDFIEVGAHTGLAAQVEAGDVDTVVIWIGTNDYSPANQNYADVYNEVVVGADLTSKENSIIDNLTFLVDLLQESGNIRIILLNFLDPGPVVTGSFPDPIRRGYVTASIGRVNTALTNLVAARGNIVLANYSGFYSELQSQYPGVIYDYYVIYGWTIDFQGANDEPHFMVLASNHMGTITNAIITKWYILDPLNSSMNVNIATFTDREIVLQAVDIEPTENITVTDTATIETDPLSINKTETITVSEPTVNAEITTGQVSVSDNKPAYLFGSQSALSNTPVYLTGQQLGSSNTPVYLSGFSTALSNSPSYLAGQQTTSGNTPVHLGGSQGTLSNIPVFTVGGINVNNNTPVFTSGGINTTANQPVYTSGGINTSDNKPVYLTASVNITGNRPVYVVTEGQATETSSSTPVYLAVIATGISNAPTYTRGQLSSLDNKPTYTKGQDTGASNAPTYLIGQDTTLDSKPVYLNANLSVTSSAPVYVEGYSPGTSAVPVYLIGSNTETSNKSVYLSGGNQAASNIPAYTSGNTTASSNAPTYLTGSNTGTSSTPVYVEGIIRSSTPVFLSGIDTTLSSRPVFLEGVLWYTSHVPVFIEGTSVNDELFFDLEIVRSVGIDTDPTLNVEIETIPVLNVHMEAEL